VRAGALNACGSLGEFDHVVWEVAQLARSTHRQIENWLNRLDPALTKIATEAKRPQGLASGQWLVEFGSRDFFRIQQIPSLDALALLTLVIQQAHRNGMGRVAQSAGYAVCAMILQLAWRFRTLELAQDVLLHYEKWVLPMTCFNHQRLSFGDHPQEALRSLSRFIRVVNSNIRPLKTDLDIDRQIRKVLNGRYGYERRQIFMPVLVPSMNHSSVEEAGRHVWPLK